MRDGGPPLRRGAWPKAGAQIRRDGLVHALRVGELQRLHDVCELVFRTRHPEAGIQPLLLLDRRIPE